MSTLKKYTCFFVLLGTVLFAINAEEYTFDRNKDGKPDQWFEYEDGIAILEKRDRNFDGVIDYTAKFDNKNRKIYEEIDFNYDGQMDDFYYYEEGLLVLRKIVSNYDGQIDIFIYITDGIIYQSMRWI